MKIFAVDNDMIFDKSYCRRVMKLPFRRGWSEYQVFAQVGQDLEFKGKFPTYDDAVVFIESTSYLYNNGRPRDA